MKTVPYKNLMVRIAPHYFRLLKKQKSETGATLTWLVENAIRRTYGSKADKRRQATE